jgi:hypothetical protein
LQAVRRSDEFFTAVQSGNTGRVRELLASDPALAREKDAEGATALHHATEHGQREIVKLLLQSGADINTRDDRFHATPTGWAIEYLRGLGGLQAVEIEDMLFAIRERDARWVRRLLVRWPALVQATDLQGQALSQLASESGDEEIARLFKDTPGSA